MSRTLMKLFQKVSSLKVSMEKNHFFCGIGSMKGAQKAFCV